MRRFLLTPGGLMASAANGNSPIKEEVKDEIQVWSGAEGPHIEDKGRNIELCENIAEEDWNTR